MPCVTLKMRYDMKMDSISSQEDAVEILTEKVGGEDYEYVPLSEHIVRAIGVCSGRPTFKYTRIEVEGALNRLRSGETLDSIVSGYGGRVPREAIQEAIDLATQPSLPDLTPVLLRSMSV